MTRIEKIAYIAVTDRGLDHARLLRSRFRIGELYRPARYGSADKRWERPFEGELADTVAELFPEYDQLVFFLAAGAVTRLIAPHLGKKTTDPGVTVVDESARHVVPLLSGHEGGANDFARRVAGALGATPVITTASDHEPGFNLTQLEAAFGYAPEPRDRQKDLALALANHQPVAAVQRLTGPGARLDQMELPDHVSVVSEPGQLETHPAAVAWITDRIDEDTAPIDPQRIVLYRPPSLILGLGCERGVSLESLEDGLDRFLQNHGYAKNSIAALASLNVKRDEPAIQQLAEKHGWGLHFYDADTLTAAAGEIEGSDTVQQCVGTPAVAEPAALHAAEAAAPLVPKEVCTSELAAERMTFALARRAGYKPHDAAGRVYFIGAGPGDPDLLTLKAQKLIRGADTILYAGSLIPERILADAPPHAHIQNSAHLTLEQTSEIVIAAARRGERVVRLHSGCLTAYSAIQEQMTVLDEAGLSYEVIPGISAFQAAAAHLKAELTLPERVQSIILTRAEGKTPMPEGESLESLAQHQASLAIFLSARMSQKVQDQLLTAYPPETPVSIHYRVSWPDQQNVVTDLAHLHETIRACGFTRTTLIMVGDAVTGRHGRSNLYEQSHSHIFRQGTGKAARAAT
jgi:precorrin-4 C11-methyltransferase